MPVGANVSIVVRQKISVLTDITTLMSVLPAECSLKM